MFFTGDSFKSITLPHTDNCFFFMPPEHIFPENYETYSEIYGWCMKFTFF